MLERFGITAKELEIFNRVLLHRIQDHREDALSKCRQFDRIPIKDRQVYRQLFARMVRSVKRMESASLPDFKLFLDTADGFTAPRRWSLDAKDAVVRMITAAHAGVANLQIRELPVQRGNQATFDISWNVRSDGTDLNTYWVMTLTLALLREKALYVLLREPTC